MSFPHDQQPIDAEIVPLPEASVPGATAPTFEDVTGYTEAGVPTLDHVRDKIERRTTVAIGSEELAGMIPEVQDAEDAFAKREQAAKDKLAQIRKSMGNPSTGSGSD
ncbi:MAG: hypothetical protein QM658_14295 [Gordonia sp. (in: high G+C Gram-positive bacteria)]